ATARDINNSIVLTSPSKMQWASSNLAVATVSATGKVTGLGGGGSNITATDTESGISGTTAVLVNALIHIPDNGNNRIVRMDDINGTNWTVFPPAGSSIVLTNPVGVSIAPDDSLIIADQDADRILRVSNFTDPNSVSTFGTSGINPGQFRRPSGAVVGP